MKKSKKGVRFIPHTKEVLSILRKYWKRYEEVESEFRHSVQKIEEEMQKDLKEPLLEFFWSDNSVVGIGTPADPKIMKLVHSEDLADGK